MEVKFRQKDGMEQNINRHYSSSVDATGFIYRLDICCLFDLDLAQQYPGQKNFKVRFDFASVEYA